MSFYKNPVLLSVFLGLVSVLLSYIESKVNNLNRSNKDYIKLFCIVSLSVLGGTYICNSKTNLASFKDQEMLTGDPGF